MKRLLFTLTAICLCTLLSAQSANDKILGKWSNQDQTRIIEFVKNGSTYDAIILKAEDKNVVGKKQITGLIADGDKKFKNGMIHILQKDKLVNCKAQLIDDNKLEIKATKGMMSKSQVWTRCKDEK